MDKKRWKRRFAKARQWAAAYLACWLLSVREAFVTDVVKAVFLSGLVLLIVSRVNADASSVVDEAVAQQAAILAGGAVFLVSVVVSAFRAMLSASSKFAEAGTWEGDLYIEHSPRLLVAMRLSDTSKEIRRRIKVEGAPENALASVKMEVEPNSPYWEVEVLPIGWPLWGADRVANENRGGGVVWKGSLDLVAKATRPDASPVTIRVYLKEWTVQ